MTEEGEPVKKNKVAIAIAITVTAIALICPLVMALDSQSVTYKGEIAGDQALINLQDATPVTQIMPWPNAAWTNSAGAPTNRFQPTSMTSIYWPTTDANGHRLAYILFTNPPTTLIGITPTFDQAVSVIATLTTNESTYSVVGSVTTNESTYSCVGSITTNASGTAGDSTVATYTMITRTNYALAYTMITRTNYSLAWTTRVVSNYNDTVLLTNTYTFYHSNLWMNTTGVTNGWKMVH